MAIAWHEAGSAPPISGREHDQAEHGRSRRSRSWRNTRKATSTTTSPLAMPRRSSGRAGLDRRRSRAERCDEPAGAVHCPVDDLRVEPPQRVARQHAAAREDRPVQVVDVDLFTLGDTGPARGRTGCAATKRAGACGLEHVQAVGKPDRRQRRMAPARSSRPSWPGAEALVRPGGDRAGQDARPELLRPEEDLLQPVWIGAALRRQAEQTPARMVGMRQDDQRRDDGRRRLMDVPPGLARAAPLPWKVM